MSGFTSTSIKIAGRKALYENLRTQSRKRKKRTHKKDKRGMIIDRMSIHERLEIVDQRECFGDCGR